MYEHIAKWMNDQMDTVPASSHRQYYRQRTRPRVRNEGVNLTMRRVGGARSIFHSFSLFTPPTNDQASFRNTNDVGINMSSERTDTCGRHRTRRDAAGPVRRRLSVAQLCLSRRRPVLTFDLDEEFRDL